MLAAHIHISVPLRHLRHGMCSNMCCASGMAWDASCRFGNGSCWPADVAAAVCEMGLLRRLLQL